MSGLTSAWVLSSGWTVTVGAGFCASAASAAAALPATHRPAAQRNIPAHNWKQTRARVMPPSLQNQLSLVATQTSGSFCTQRPRGRTHQLTDGTLYLTKCASDTYL